MTGNNDNNNYPLNYNNGFIPDYNYNDMYHEDMYNGNVEDLNYRNRGGYGYRGNRGRYYNNNYNNNGWYPGCDRYGRCGNSLWWMFWPFFFL